MKQQIFHAKQLMRPGVLRKFEDARTVARASADEIADVNWRKRRALLDHVFSESSFYKERFKALDIDPRDINSEADWAKLPITTKEDIRLHWERILTVPLTSPVLKASVTGGSTGAPLKVYHDTRFPCEILGWRMLEWWGRSPADNAAFCWRLLRTSRLKKLLNTILWWPTSRVWLDASHMDDERVRKFLRDINNVRPAYIQGYTGALAHVAERVIDGRLITHSPACLWGTSSPVSRVQRELIQKAFGAPLYDQYGCSEIFWLAAECQEQNGLHFFADSRHLDIVPETAEDSGAYGHVLLTDLENFAFPLIRYENGDRAAWSNRMCSCGVNLPLIEPVRGRVTDLIRSPEGSVISGDYITTLFDDWPDLVKAFQVRQYRNFDVELQVVPNGAPGVADAAIAQVIENLRGRLGHSLGISSKVVGGISSDQGKTRFVVSDLERPRHD